MGQRAIYHRRLEIFQTVFDRHTIGIQVKYKVGRLIQQNPPGKTFVVCDEATQFTVIHWAKRFSGTAQSRLLLRPPRMHRLEIRRAEQYPQNPVD